MDVQLVEHATAVGGSIAAVSESKAGESFSFPESFRETWPYRRADRRGCCDQALRENRAVPASDTHTHTHTSTHLSPFHTHSPPMADIEQGSAAPLPADGAPLQEANGTDALNATAAKFVATAEGTALAYGSLVLMALLPIFFGALRSVSSSKSKVGAENGYENASDMPETITSRDAARFPIIASCTLFGLYLFFKIFSQEYINMLLSMYFFVLGILALSHTMSPFMNRVFPANLPNKQYQLLFTQGSGENKEEIVNYEFDTKDLICLAISSVVGVWYVLKKHWVANNLFGLAFALNGVELLHLNNVSTGCILLGGLFVYDVFWVFGTNVMVTVAKSFEAPIKLVFPQDLLERGLNASNFAMLGLGDIVIPGIFIALLLRFDVSLKNNSRTYFYTSFLAYIFGLGLTIFVMHTFKHAQPALLYLVPACVGFPVVVALLKGELTEMFRYEEVSPEAEASQTEEKTESEKDK
uniref:Histocompatibility (minor) 13 n=1 Tax=Astyanax mexicanus TaxID=7994 RepID=A0A3B1K2M3_ASTMX